MNGFSIGPFLFSAERVAAVLAIAAVLGVGELLGRRLDPRFGRWSYLVLAVGLAAARLGYVLEHLQSFAAAPWRALAIWEGGFSWPWAILPVAVVTVLGLRRPRLIVWGTGTLAAIFLGWSAVQTVMLTPPDTPLPNLVLQALTGPPVQLAATENKPEVINLWATWCPPCRREMPVLAQAAQAHPDVRFIFANQGESRAVISQYLAREGLALPIVLLDSARAIPRYYGVQGIPVTLFISPNGRLAASHLGALSPEQLETSLAALRR